MDLSAIVSAIASSGALQNAAGQAGVDHGQAQDMLSGILGHLTDGGPVEGMIDSVAEKAGVDPALVNQFLPMVLPLLQSHADANGEQTGGLGGLIGALGGAGGAGGLIGLAASLLGNKA